MTRSNKQYFIVGVLSLMLAAQASFGGSAPIMKARCSEDSLENGQAIERTEWAAKCGHITASERQYNLYDGGNPRPRSLYPLYGTEDMSQLWRAPVDRNAACSVPGGMSVVAFCTASCYTPDQEILFPEGFLEIKSAKEQVLPDVMALRDTSHFDNLKFVFYPVESYTEEVRPTWHDILRRYYSEYHDDPVFVFPLKRRHSEAGIVKRIRNKRKEPMTTVQFESWVSHLRAQEDGLMKEALARTQRRCLKASSIS